MSKKKNKAMKVYNGFYNKRFVKIHRAKDFFI